MQCSKLFYSISIEKNSILEEKMCWVCKKKKLGGKAEEEEEEEEEEDEEFLSFFLSSLSVVFVFSPTAGFFPPLKFIV